jgi:hypothetical protein
VAWTPLALRDRPADPPPALRDGAPTRSIDPTRHRAPYRPQGTGLKVPYKRASMLECAVRPCAVRPCCAHALCAHALRQCTVRACDPRGACAPHSGRMRREPSRQTDGVVRRPPQSSHPISLWMPIALEAYVPRSDVSDVMANVAGALLFCIFDGHRVRQAQRQTWFHEHHASSTPRAALLRVARVLARTLKESRCSEPLLIAGAADPARFVSHVKRSFRSVSPRFDTYSKLSSTRCSFRQ